MTERTGARVVGGDSPVWDAYSLPDSAFAYVAPGGTKDASGRTEPRDQRYLPHHDETGELDADLVEQCPAALDNTSFGPADAHDEAKAHLRDHADALGLYFPEETSGRDLSYLLPP